MALGESTDPFFFSHQRKHPREERLAFSNGSYLSLAHSLVVGDGTSSGMSRKFGPMSKFSQPKFLANGGDMGDLGYFSPLGLNSGDVLRPKAHRW